MVSGMSDSGIPRYPACLMNRINLKSGMDDMLENSRRFAKEDDAVLVSRDA